MQKKQSNLNYQPLQNKMYTKQELDQSCQEAMNQTIAYIQMTHQLDIQDLKKYPIHMVPFYHSFPLDMKYTLG